MAVRFGGRATELKGLGCGTEGNRKSCSSAVCANYASRFRLPSSPRLRRTGKPVLHYVCWMVEDLGRCEVSRAGFLLRSASYGSPELKAARVDGRVTGVFVSRVSERSFRIPASFFAKATKDKKAGTTKRTLDG